jgi:hypothetical protein
VDKHIHRGKMNEVQPQDSDEQGLIFAEAPDLSQTSDPGMMEQPFGYSFRMVD